jgi:hypothetical protein
MEKPEAGLEEGDLAGADAADWARRLGKAKNVPARKRRTTTDLQYAEYGEDVLMGVSPRVVPKAQTTGPRHASGMRISIPQSSETGI